MKMYYVYFILLSNGDIYTCCTEDLVRRFAEHKNNKVRSTSNKVKALIGYEAYREKSDAKRRERYLKTTEGKRLFKQQYRDILIKLRKGARVV